MVGLRENQKAERRIRMLDAARRHFLESGFEAATIEAIAKTAEVSAVTVYNYYSTKRGLLLALVGQSDDILIGKIDAFMAALPDDPVEALAGISLVIRDHNLGYLKRRIWRHVIATSVIEGSSDFGRSYAALDQKLGERFVDLFEILTRRGALDPAIDCTAAGATLFKLQNARFVEFMADDALIPTDMDRRFRGDITFVLDHYMADRDGISA